MGPHVLSLVPSPFPYQPSPRRCHEKISDLFVAFYFLEPLAPGLWIRNKSSSNYSNRVQQALDANYQISAGPHFLGQYGKHLLNCTVRRGSTARPDVPPLGSSSCLQGQESTLMYSVWPVQPHWAAGEDADSLSLSLLSARACGCLLDTGVVRRVTVRTCCRANESCS